MPTVASGIGQFAAIQAVAPIGMELSTIGVRDADEVEHAIAAFARDPNGGLVVTASGFGANHPRSIATLAARHNLPAVYPFRYFVDAGGLISYGPDYLDQYRRAAGYVDRILKGEKPADLPVQAPTKFELVDQPQDRQGARPRRAADAARARRRGDRMKRREFIALLGGAALRGRCGARAAGRARATHRLARWRRGRSGRAARIDGVRQALAQWAGPTAATCGSIIAGAGGTPTPFASYAAELVALAPDVILVTGTASLAAMLQVTRTVPIVFVIVVDPVGAGFVDSLSRPGGNATGFMQFEYSLSGKWLELLKQIAPHVTRVAVLREPANRRDRPVRRHPVRGALARPGGHPDQRARRARNRARRRGLRTLPEWRPDRDGERASVCSSRPDRRRLRRDTSCLRSTRPATFVIGGGLISYGV